MGWRPVMLPSDNYLLVYKLPAADFVVKSRRSLKTTVLAGWQIEHALLCLYCSQTKCMKEYENENKRPS
jgi:hypothetical protein